MAFLRGLKRNNRREWFQPRKHIFDEAVRAPMLDLVDAVQHEMAGFAPAYIGDPRKVVYRIYRDTRFSGDKTPYKTQIAASFPRQGMEKHGGAGYYFSISPEEVAVGGGIYMPLPQTLLSIRRHVGENHAAFHRICGEKRLRTLMGDMQGEQLTRVPTGFPASHPAADLLRFKQFLFYIELDGSLATSPRVLPELVKRFRLITPFIEFLNMPLGMRTTAQGK